MDTDLWREERLLIDGTLVEAADGTTFENVNPAKEEAIGVAADGSPTDMARAIAAARRAFDTTSWSTDVELRVRCLRQLSDALAKHAEELRATLVAEAGTPLVLTYGAQLDSPLAGVAWVADLVERYQWEKDLGNAEPFGIPSHRYTRREAVGVVGAITPWNFPLQINLAKAGPALGAGNTVVLKPAPDTPWTASLLGRIVVDETDIPPGVLNIVTSSGHEVGAQLSADPQVDMVSFTGSTATGRRVMVAAAATVKKTFLELGGKSAIVALDDADMAAAAAAAAFQITTHAGQGCAITSRLLLPRSRVDEGVDAVVEVMRGIPYGDPADPGVMMGPLVREGQRQRVLGYIRKGIDEGATLALGGGVPAHLVTFTENPASLGFPSFHDGVWDPFWRALCDEGVVLSIQLGSSGKLAVTSPDAPVDVMITLQPMNICQAAADLVWSRVLKQFPDLRIALSEGGTGWIPYFLDRLDRTYEMHRAWTGQDFGDRLPSEVFRQHFLTCFISDPVGIELRHMIGIDNIAWECDYPHSDSSWPAAPEELAEAARQVPDDELNRIGYENACRWYSFDPFAHRLRERCTVGALRAAAAGHDVAIRSFDKGRFRREQPGTNLGELAKSSPA